ncbi:gamma-glutamyl-gamma-aminobutyrate hydrolase family protein [Halobacillus shinanisalinarum]|uniref:Gamma-glutamyl-gamma-aminobutyrate hydrolase family protein n=1 Tax=Halobacillus shinanisalinarum TaxID=2932258 RepID=A0ABY4GYW0_9BACI|nr:gamma-glutamyl-gamma-aminobutyrate hydrolase family protein [Halobacillus shinanisalinarum]UOQ91972.1 gamma-glutamyl-gamma-aminobutyrate hydrolase family protein [Halobacillus shinanisalinarum]
MKQLTRPVIGITSSTVNHNNIPSINLHERYIRSVIQAGGIPAVIPTGTEEGMAEVWCSICSGIILSSGEDVDPNSYQAEPYPKIQKTNGKRDKLEIELVKNAQKQTKPILALCRGITMLNAALGGTVLQDIETNNSNAINHYQQAARPEPTHEIQIDNQSRLYQIFNRSNIRVNSMHHQAIDQLAPNLKPVAFAPDGIIEAVEGVNGTSLLWGIQWHPEEMASEDPSMVQLFKEFVTECTNK